MREGLDDLGSGVHCRSLGGGSGKEWPGSGLGTGSGRCQDSRGTGDGVPGLGKGDGGRHQVWTSSVFSHGQRWVMTWEGGPPTLRHRGPVTFPGAVTFTARRAGLGWSQGPGHCFVQWRSFLHLPPPGGVHPLVAPHHAHSPLDHAWLRWASELQPRPGFADSPSVEGGLTLTAPHGH